jgi:DNA-binding MarR family transcriptional regulator
VTDHSRLTDDQARAWRAMTRLQEELRAGLAQRLQRGCALSLPDHDVLAELRAAPAGRLRPYLLARALRWEQSRLSHHLARMQRRGLVRREQCAGDGRGAFVAITATGRRALDAAAPTHAAALRALLFAHLTRADVAALERVCGKALAADPADADDGVSSATGSCD